METVVTVSCASTWHVLAAWSRTVFNVLSKASMHFPSEMCFILPKSMDEPKSVGLLWVIIFIILYGIVSIIFHKFIFLPFYDYNTCVTSWLLKRAKSTLSSART